VEKIEKTKTVAGHQNPRHLSVESPTQHHSSHALHPHPIYSLP
jgi:hypothetical protein